MTSKNATIIMHGAINVRNLVNLIFMFFGITLMLCKLVNIVQWYNVDEELGSRDESECCNWLYVFRQIVHEMWYDHNCRKHSDS